jgi:hypothetical protein
MKEPVIDKRRPPQSRRKFRERSAGKCGRRELDLGGRE